MSQVLFGFMDEPDDSQKDRSHPRWIAFFKYHELNPHVYAACVRITREEVAAGATYVSIKHVWELVRKELKLTPLCNNWHAFYARIIMEQNPDLDGIFELRRQPSLET